MDATAPVALVSRDEEIPLSFAQHPWWQKEQKSPRNFACAIPMALRLSGEIDIPALERSFNEIIRRHESLRTSFVNVNGGALQNIAPFRTMQLQVLDLQSYPEGEREQELLRVAGEEARRGFDLRAGPLLRASLVRMGADDQALLVSVHRISADGWSIGVLLRELTVLYDAYSAGEESPLEELPIQYADYTVWQRGWLQGEILERHLKYWTQQLAGGASVPELPTDFPRRKTENQRGDSHSFLLAKSLCEKLSAFNRQESATMYMTLLAALQTLVHRYSGLTDIRVGSPVANRTHAELEGLIGCFSNTLVMRGDLSGNPTFRELLGRVREVTLGAYAHQDLPYIKLLEAMRPEDAGNRQRLFHVMFVLLNAPMPEVDVADLMPVSSTTSRFELILTMARLEEGLEATFEYNAELFARETIERLAIHFVKLLERVAANPDLRLSNLLPSL